MQCPLRTFLVSRWIAAIWLAASVPLPAAARTTGIVGYSGQADGLYCSNAGFGCHATATGTMAPLVRFEGPTQVDPGAEVTYRFVVTSQVPQVQIQAGFNVAASAGDLVIVSGQGEKLLTNPLTQIKELTHTGPKDNDTTHEAAWQFTWRAPSPPGTYVLFGAGNSVDASTTPDGDEAAITMLMVAVGDVPPSPTPTATPVAAACAGDCNGDRMVAVNELIASVNIALGSAAVTACAACDVNQDGMVSVSELVAAVGKALNGC
jgi:hypothetical protein